MARVSMPLAAETRSRLQVTMQADGYFRAIAKMLCQPFDLAARGGREAAILTLLQAIGDAAG